MDLDKILQFIPDLLLYFVPGFICLRIKEAYGFQKKHEELGSVIYSILYSFIVLILFSCLKAVFLPYIRDRLPEDQVENIKRIIFIGLGIILGLVITAVPKWKWWGKLTGKIIPFTSAEQSVWEKAMTNHCGAKAKVLLKNGLTYEGDLGYATGDPDDSDKTVLIYNFKSYERNKEEDGKNINQIIYIKDNYRKTDVEDDMEKVYIRPDEIVSVEICPTPEDVSKAQKRKQEEKKKRKWFLIRAKRTI